MEAHFGSSGRWYWNIARGIDERPVRCNRAHKSVSAERTFDKDLNEAADLYRELERVAGYAWARIERSGVRGKTVTLKVKFADFTLITRSRTYPGPILSLQTFQEAGTLLLEALLPVAKGIRLLGLGVHSIVEDGGEEPKQLGLAI